MLPRANRMTDPAEFRRCFKEGTRAGSATLVVHCRTDEDLSPSLVGFVVPKKEIMRANGRNRVKRQLRHLMRERLANQPQSARIVVRITRQALGMTSKELGKELDSALRRAWKKNAQRADQQHRSHATATEEVTT